MASTAQAAQRQTTAPTQTVPAPNADAFYDQDALRKAGVAGAGRGALKGLGVATGTVGPVAGAVATGTLAIPGFGPLAAMAVLGGAALVGAATGGGIGAKVGREREKEAQRLAQAEKNAAMDAHASAQAAAAAAARGARRNGGSVVSAMGPVSGADAWQRATYGR